VNRGGTGEYLLAKALANQDIPADKVDTLYLSPADAAYAFTTGNIDAWAVWDPYVAIAQVRDHARIIAGSHEIGSENATIIVVRDGLLDKDPAAVRLIYDAVLAESRWDTANTRAAAELWGKDAGLDAAVIDLIAKRQPAIYGPVNEAVIASLQRVAQWFHDRKIIPALPDARDFVYDVSRTSPS
jgi:sulfonate transport system substrate-binding protein